VTNVLVVTTTVGMVDRVHGHTTNLGPCVTLGLVLVVRVAGLQDGLVDTATTGNDADHGTTIRGDGLLGTRGELDLGGVVVSVVGDDGGVVARAAGKDAAIAGATFDVANDGTLRELANREDVANVQLGLLASVDELARVHALSGDEELLGAAILIGVVELNTGQRGTTAGIVNDFADNTLDVAVTLGKVQSAVLSGALTAAGVGLED